MRTESQAAPFLTGWIAEADAGLAGAGLDWLERQRSLARQRVLAEGVPTAKQEAWRYTGLKSLLEQPSRPAWRP
jgi:Fe-S cluster assembly protein SufD